MSAGCQQALPRSRASRCGGERCSEAPVRHLVSVSVSLTNSAAADQACVLAPTKTHGDTAAEERRVAGPASRTHIESQLSRLAVCQSARICRESDRHARRAVASVCARRQRHTPLRRSVARLCRPSGLGRVLPRLTRRGVALAERGQRGRAGSRSHTCCATGHSLRSTCLAWRVGRPSRSVGWLGRRRAVGKSGEPGRCRGRSAT